MPSRPAGLPRCLSTVQALAIIRDGAGTQFDPTLVEAFMQVAGQLSVAS